MNDRFLRACRHEPVDATPVWFMRQAGRSFAAYRKLRERYGILELAKTPDLCAEVTLMPVDELGVDAAVLFADIMLPLEPMGVGLRIEPEVGPIDRRADPLGRRRRALRPFDPAEVVVHARGDPAGPPRAGRPGRRHRLLGRAVHARLLPDRGPARRATSPRPRRSCIASPRPGTTSWSGCRTMIVAYLRAQVEAGARRRPALRQLGRRPRAGATTASSSSPTSARIFAALRDRADHPLRDRRRPRCWKPWPRPAATSSGSTTGSRSPTPGDAARARARRSRATSTRRGCWPAGRRPGPVRRAVLDEAAGRAGPRLQPGPRRAAGHGHGPAAPARRPRPRGDRADRRPRSRWRA